MHSWVVSPTTPVDTGCDAIKSGSKWFATDDCRSTYLRWAVEMIDDEVGNDNGLCESDETCLFTPNIGAYQGHVVAPETNCTTRVGDFYQVAVMGTGGVHSNMVLLAFDTNGY